MHLQLANITPRHLASYLYLAYLIDNGFHLRFCAVAYPKERITEACHDGNGLLGIYPHTDELGSIFLHRLRLKWGHVCKMVEYLDLISRLLRTSHERGEGYA